MRNAIWSYVTGAAVVSAVSVSASAATFSETFDDGLADSRWSVVRTTTDTGADFGFNYSTLIGPNGSSIGVPRAGQATTTGLQLWANRGGATGNATEGINAYANELNLSGAHVMEFDIYSHWTVPATSTNYSTFGFYHSTQTGTWNSIANATVPAATSGYWFTASGDGGSTTDYRAHEAGTNIGAAANYRGSSQDSANAAWQSLFPDLDSTGTRSVAGTIANRWVTMRITRNGGQILWEIKNAGDANFTQAFSFTDPSETNPDGTITLGMTDPFGSATPEDTFFIFDNVSVTPVPEPTSLAVLGLSGLALLRRRRA